jgi:phosphoserine aminotransferase
MRQAEADLRSALAIPPNYRVLYMHGGAHAQVLCPTYAHLSLSHACWAVQFAAVAMNLGFANGTARSADYVVTGFWSQRAADEAAKQIKVRLACCLRPR